MYINWEGPLIKISPEFGSDLQADHQKGVPTPTYGSFGGPQIFGQEGGPVDTLDAFFAFHDGLIAIASNNGQEMPTPQELVEAHAQLIAKITDLPSENGLLSMHSPPDNPEDYPDAEATLYAGFTMFALTAQVMQLDELDGPNDLLGQFEDELAELDPALTVSTVLTKAAEYMETGLEAVPNEGKGLNGLFHIWEHQFDIA